MGIGCGRQHQPIEITDRLTLDTPPGEIGPVDTVLKVKTVSTGLNKIMKIHTKACFYVFLFISLFILNGCSGSGYQETDVPVETPGAIEKLDSAISFKEMTAVDWRFDPNRILFMKGVHGEPYVTPFDLVWLDISRSEFIPLNVPEDGMLLSCPAQGKDGQVVYGREILYLFDTQTREKIPIADGCYTKFSPSGTKIAYVSRKGLEIYNINDRMIEQAIALLPLEGETARLETESIGWRMDEQAVYVVYTWIDENSQPYRSQIREIDLQNLNQLVIFEGREIGDFSWSPDGRLIALVETDRPNHQTILKIIQVENRCEIAERIFPPYSGFVRWSPAGDKILIDFSMGLQPYLIDVAKVFGASYKELNCKQ